MWHNVPGSLTVARRELIFDPGRGGGMVYADGSNPSVRKDIGVRLPFPALYI